MAFNMIFKLFLRSLTVLFIAKVTLGKIDCEIGPFEICGTPKVFNEIPREVSEFYDHCVETKSYFRCINEYQVECGTKRMDIFPTPELFEDTYDIVSEICEEGTLFNTIVTDHLKCFNETFGKTKCREGAEEFVEPLVRRIRESEGIEYTLSIFCLEEALTTECALHALSENCGKLLEETTLGIIRRLKSLEYACSKRGAQSVLDELDTLDLSEDRKKTVVLLLEKLVEEHSD
ncbi:hypothetical protein AVEN_275247-1 [Araneus ventricosus]|uniref:DUF19 domain-containing protein n=1 Tax=Araneus ventricosus TaxID=182803 RepID=A0A4Y2JPA6_ARAVE|nr:hypothetical protein AVEN_275247-1 [Araneus ventricosus]